MAIILKPIVTEKMTAAGEKFNRYGFQVVRTANKVEIKKAVEELYNVQVLDVFHGEKQGKKFAHKSLPLKSRQAFLRQEF